ncbi:MAG: HAMP domain-containing histidine kinase [Alphaproteobacteria bacterium]|nr:HAMP domain-containing histidine kinase [Alphaproteobacteria bacterium]MDE2339647.1 HAMP domain-containing histidine kinase [Alphaproteobacteria bacterium]
MITIAALWIIVLLVGGGLALEQVLSSALVTNEDQQLEYVLNAMIASAELGPDGEVRLDRQLGDQLFLEPYSGHYWQITGTGYEPFLSRSLWDRHLYVSPPHHDRHAHFYDSDEFAPEHLRVVERDIILPGSPVHWRFQVAESSAELDSNIAKLRRVLIVSFLVLGLGLILMATLQTLYGLWPLRQLRDAIAAMRSGKASRIALSSLPREVAPLVNELNELLAHNEQQAEEARTHAGNLAHALKTPLTVIVNEATANSPNLADMVIREAATMRRQVDHHLARARAVGRRSAVQSRTAVWPALESVERAVGLLYPDVRIDRDGQKTLSVRVERQDLDEMLGNLIENAAKYGGGSAFVTVCNAGEWVDLLIEDDGAGIPAAERERIFDRGARLDTSKPGTGLGLAIVRDVAEIYGGSVALEESDDMGGLLVRLRLPRAE